MFKTFGVRVAWRVALRAACLLPLLFGVCGRSFGQDAQQQADQEITAITASAEAFLGTYKEPTASTEASWGLHNFRVFGPFSLAPDVVKLDLQKGQATYQIWCKGLVGDNTEAKRKRTLVLRLSKVKDVWGVTDAEFTRDEPLTLGLQLGGWLVAFIAGIAVLFLVSIVVRVLCALLGALPLSVLSSLVTATFGFIGLVPALKDGLDSKSGRAVLTLLSAAYIGGAGWLFFASWFAVVAPTLVWLLLGVSVLMAQAAEERRAKARHSAEDLDAFLQKMRQQKHPFNE